MLVEIPERYPFTAPVGSPVLRGLVVSNAYKSTERLPLFPLIYEFKGPHPSHRVKLRGSRTFVYLVDSSPRGKALADAIWSTQTVPGGSVRGKCLLRLTVPAYTECLKVYEACWKSNQVMRCLLDR